MAKGIKYTNQPLGTFGGLRHYIDPTTGNYIISEKGGVSDQLIKHNPTLERMRENYTEFGNSVQWTAMVRANLDEIIHLCFGNYTSWINKMSKTIQKMDPEGLRGKRGVISSSHKSLLTTLNFNERHPFRQVMPREPEVIASEDRKTITVNFPGFNSRRELRWPSEYSYYRFTLQIGQLSDLYWSVADKKLVPEYLKAHDNRVVVRSEWFTISTDNVNVSLTASFQNDKLPQENVTVMVGLGIEIGKRETPGTISFTKGDGTMALIACL
jgi:hypothetical protein